MGNPREITYDFNIITSAISFNNNKSLHFFLAYIASAQEKALKRQKLDISPKGNATSIRNFRPHPKIHIKRTEVKRKMTTSE